MSSYRVKQIVVHPQHNHISYFSWNDDIALIELTQPVPDYIKVASIPDVGVKLRKCKSAGKTNGIKDGSSPDPGFRTDPALS